MSGLGEIPEDAPLFMANRILDNVFVGSHYAAEDEDFIFTNTISRVINTVSAQVPNRFQALNVRYLSYHFDASGGSQIFDAKDERITQVVRFVNEALEEDTCVLIHSLNGDSRAVVLMAAYLIHRFHWPPHRALQFVATKRSCSKPNAVYVKQLHEFAGRRRAKYGEFKDIFGGIRGLKLNHQEILHRNTFLNAIQAEDPPDLSVTQNSPLDVLIKLGAVEKQINESVTFRDGLQTAEISSNYANFDANGRPINPSMTSQLFRPRTPSYISSEEIRCLPVRLDPALLPAASFDLDLAPHHVRREDGYLQPISQECSGFAVVARPVSILKRMGARTREAYDKEAFVVGVSDWEKILRDTLMRPEANNPVEPSSGTENAYETTSGRTQQMIPSSQTQTTSNEQHVEAYEPETEPSIEEKPSYNASVSLNQVNMQVPHERTEYSTTEETFADEGEETQRQASKIEPNYAKPGEFTKIRPPTPPRKQDPPTTATQQSEFRFPQAKVEENRPEISYRPIENKNAESMSGYGFNQKVGVPGNRVGPAPPQTVPISFGQAPLSGRNAQVPAPRNGIVENPEGPVAGQQMSAGQRWK